MRCYRYITPVLKGRWWPNRDEALSDALIAGQAYVTGKAVQLFEFARIESREEFGPRALD